MAKPGELPEHVKIEVNAWLNQRDWNFDRGFWCAGVACAHNAEMILNGYLRGKDANRSGVYSRSIPG